MPQPALIPPDGRAARITRAVDVPQARTSRGVHDRSFSDALDSAAAHRRRTARADNNDAELTAKPRPAVHDKNPTPRDTKASQQNESPAFNDEPNASDAARSAKHDFTPDESAVRNGSTSDGCTQGEPSGEEAHASPDDAQSLPSNSVNGNAGAATDPLFQGQIIAEPVVVETPQPGQQDSEATGASTFANAGVSETPSLAADASLIAPSKLQANVDDLAAPPAPPIESNAQATQAAGLIIPADDADHALKSEQTQSQHVAPAGDPAARPTESRPALQLSPTLSDAAAERPLAQDAPNDAEAGLNQDRSGAGRNSGRAAMAADDADGRATPAVARAAQVDAAVRVENAAGNAPGAAATLPTHSDIAAQTTTLAGLNRPAAANGSGTSLQQQAATTPNGAGLDDPRFSSGVVRGLSALLKQRGGTLTMRLDPPELGSLRVQMTIARGVVSAQFEAGSAQAQGLLERNLAALRGALEAHGLTVDRLAVHSPQPANAAGPRDGAADERGAGHHDADAGGRESRGRRDGDEHPHGRSHWRESFARRFDPFGLVAASAE